VGSSNKQILTYQHDPAGRLTQIMGIFGGNSITSTSSYDGYSRTRGVVSSAGLTGSLSYDLLNRPLTIGWNGNDGATSQSLYEALVYNPLTGDIDQITREFGTFQYSHNILDELLSSNYTGTAQLGAAVNRGIQYDLVGNRVQDSINGPGQFVANVLLSDNKAINALDADGLGRLSQKIDRVNGVVQKFGYLADGKLSHFENGSVSVNYAVDALGRRVSKSVQQDSNSFIQSYTYLGNSEQIMFGKAGDGGVTLYLHGQGSNNHLAEVSVFGAKSYVKDQLDSVLNSQASGSV
jgi:hypothetical protein